MNCQDKDYQGDSYLGTLMKTEVPLAVPRPDKPISILDPSIPLSAYCEIDLSTANKELRRIDLTQPSSCQAYIDSFLAQKGAEVAYGGYLEIRNLYGDKPAFSEGSVRNIHLGIDFWAKAGTRVMVPLDGVLHSFRNNDTPGDYGPTIVLEHQTASGTWYTLYGHLSLESLENLETGTPFRAGSVLGTLGTSDINVNYAPHLHFQLIRDMGVYQGDYPGVCAAEELEYYSRNCPDPGIVIGF